MKYFGFLYTAVVCAGIMSACSEGPQDTGIQLFNGRDLSGWSAYIWDREAKSQDTTMAIGDVWSVEDGVLICRGNPPGYLHTDREYENYRLSLEWRWPGEGGNNGVLVHTTEPNALGVWPKSIEVQLASGDAGDFWVIGTDLDVPNEEERKKDRRHINLTDNSEKPLGEWNTMQILCQGSEIKVWVNGDLVNHATNCTTTRGAISLQSEGTAINFRNIVLEPIGG